MTDDHLAVTLSGTLRMVAGRCFVDAHPTAFELPLLGAGAPAGYPLQTNRGRAIWVDGQRVSVVVHFYDVPAPAEGEEIVVKGAPGSSAGHEG